MLGWSEGAVIAPLAVINEKLDVDGLLLAGYPNENMKGILEWQNTGYPTMVIYKYWFGVTDKEFITKDDFEKDPLNIIPTVLQNVKFEDIDIDKDEQITANDFKIMLEETKKSIFKAIESNDDDWLEKNYAVYLTSNWFNEHFKLGKTEDILTKLDLPIYIFHGTIDANCPVQGVYDVKERFEKEGKNNLQTFIFEQNDHDLNFAQWIYGEEPPKSIQKIFDIVKGL